MLLLKLSLTNYRQHVDTTIEFGPWMTAIVGKNGTGKSTLLEAINHALFGELRTEGSSRAKKEGVLFNRAAPGARYKIELEFEFAGARYLVTRTDRDAQLDQILEGGIKNTVAKMQKGVTEKIVQILGLNSKQFRSSFFAEQKRLGFSLGSSPKDEVSKMVGIYAIREAGQAAGELKKDASRTLSLYNHQAIREQTEKHESDLKESTKLKAEAETAITACAAELLQKTKELEESRIEAAKAREYLRLDTELLTLANRRSGTEEQIQKARLRQAEEANRKKERDELSPKNTQWEAFNKEKTRLESLSREQDKRKNTLTQIKTLEDQLAQQQSSLAEDPSRTLEEVTKAAAEGRAQLKTLEGQVEEKRNELDTLERVISEEWAAKKAEYEGKKRELDKTQKLVDQGRCTECGQEVGGRIATNLEALRSEVDLLKEAGIEFRARYDKAKDRTELEVLNAQVRAKVEEVSALDAKVAEYKEKLRTYQAASAKLRALSTQIDDLRKTLPEVAEEFDSSRLDEVNEELKKLDPDRRRYLELGNIDERLEAIAKELEGLEGTKREIEQQEASRRDELKATGYESKESAELASSLPLRCETEKIAIEQRLKLVQERLGDLERSIERTKGDLSNLREQLEKVAACQSQELLNGETKRLLDQLADELNAELLPLLQLKASNYVALLTSGRYQQVEIDTNFEARILEDDGRPRPLLSGGEEDTLNLAMRLALCEVVQERNNRPHSLLILDEVFGSLDSDRRGMVMDQLRALRGQFRQILVISHIDEIHHVAEQCITIERDAESGRSVVSNPLASTVPELVLT